MNVKIMDIYPGTAEKWLEKNHPKQRNTRQRRVSAYAADMERGNFPISNDAICFDEDGVLVNGQNRLTACVRSGHSFQAIVVWGLPRESFKVMDTGLRRSTDDRFKMAGLEYPYGFGATVRRLCQSDKSYALVTDYDVSEFMERHSKSVIFAHKLLSGGRYANSYIRAPIARAHIHRANVSRLADFATVLQSGLPESKKDYAAVLLRNTVLESVASSGKQRADLYMLAESALSAFLEGKALRTLTPATSELFYLKGIDDGATVASNSASGRVGGNRSGNRPHRQGAAS